MSELKQYAVLDYRDTTESTITNTYPVFEWYAEQVPAELARFVYRIEFYASDADLHSIARVHRYAVNEHGSRYRYKDHEGKHSGPVAEMAPVLVMLDSVIPAEILYGQAEV